RHHRGSTLGKDSARRLQLIERNRLLLALKLFPWTLLVLNPFYFLLRLLAGVAAAGRGAGDTAHFPGLRGNFAMAGSLVRGDLAALLLVPCILIKMRDPRANRRLAPGEVRRLILANRLPLREIA